MWRQGGPALRPDPGDLGQVPLRLAPSLCAPRHLRRLLRYYGPVRLPTSARCAAPVSPCGRPPSATIPTAPVGSPGSRRWPFVREAALDPGGASPSCLATAPMQPSATGTASASTIFTLSGLTARTPHDPCLRFGPRVTATPARLGSGLPATALAGRDFHPQVLVSLPSALPNDVEKTSRGSEHVGLGSWAMPDVRGYPDMGRPVGRDPEPIVRWCDRGHRRQAASSAAAGTGVANARARSDQPSSFRKQICPEATRP